MDVSFNEQNNSLKRRPHSASLPGKKSNSFFFPTGDKNGTASNSGERSNRYLSQRSLNDSNNTEKESPIWTTMGLTDENLAASSNRKAWTKEDLEREKKLHEQEEMIRMLNYRLKNLSFVPENLKLGLNELRSKSDGSSQVYTRISLPSLKLTNIEFLKNYPNLETVELPNNQISDITVLGHLKHLVQLDLSGNRLKEALNLGQPSNVLEEADLSKNQISAISNLSQFRFLQRLCLDDNLIMKIEGLQNCHYLTSLSLRGNGIKQIENLDSLPLRYLDLSKNRIVKIENMETLSVLEELRLADNQIVSLEGIPNHPFLRSIDLRNNCIEELSEIQYIKCIRQLRHLALTKNPIHMNLEYREYLIFHLAHLTILDGFPVTPEEKVHAVNKFNPPQEVVTALRHNKQLNSSSKKYAKIKVHPKVKQFLQQKPIILCGPKGVGKRTLSHRLIKQYPNMFGLCISHTTRPPRAGEEDGVHYHFVSKKEMDIMIQEERFLQVAAFFGNTYGYSIESIETVAEEGKIGLMELEVEGAIALRETMMTPKFLLVIAKSDAIIDRLLQPEKQLHFSEEEITEKNVRVSDSHLSLAPEPEEAPSSPPGNKSNILGWMEKAKGVLKEGSYQEQNMFSEVIYNEDFEESYRRLEQIALNHYFTLYHFIREDEWKEACTSDIENGTTSVENSTSSVVDSENHQNTSFSASFRRTEAVAQI